MEIQDISEKKDNSSNLYRLLPNILTLSSLAFGLTSLKYGLAGKFEQAVLCVLIAMILDGIDGRVARLMGATSEFGAHLDSLCDLVNFGVTPSLLLYIWINPNSLPSPFLWAFALLYVMCMAIRLARFNVLSDFKSTSCEQVSDYFIGVPAPAGAFLAILPIIINFEISFNIDKKIWIFYLAIIGLLLASRIPTLSLKKIKISKSYLWLAMVFLGMFISFVIIEPWIVLSSVAIIYIIQIPFFAYVSIKKQNQK